jgi:steroid 5-alpha reductase family enzyme
VTPGFWTVAAAGLAAVLSALTLLWLVSVRLRDASIVDPFWGPGFALATLTYWLVDGHRGARGTLVLVLVAVWALRLGSHLLRRNRREGEDARYAAMRARHGERFPRVSLFRVFWLQGVILWIVSMPLLAAVRSRGPLGLLDLVGAAVAVLGIVTEAVADGQLRRFRKDPANRGRVLDSGLWRYSRHPNYFGDAVLWWGLWLVAAAGGAWWTVFSPVAMTFLLLKVSGVPLLEKGLEESRPAYADYAARTSAFVPWPPNRRAAPTTKGRGR